MPGQATRSSGSVSTIDQRPGQIGGQWTNGQPPTIDGNIIGDPANGVSPDYGWTGAWRYTFNNGNYIHDGVVQGIKDKPIFYLAFEVNHDQDLAKAILSKWAWIRRAGRRPATLRCSFGHRGRAKPCTDILHKRVSVG